MIRKPIWCKCRRHSWTRRQLISAWEGGNSIRCPEPECTREIEVEAIEALLKKIGALDLDESDDLNPSADG